MGAAEGCNDGLGVETNVGDTVGLAVWSGVGDIVVGDTVADVGSSVGKGENVGDAAVNTISQPDQTQSLGPCRLQ